MQPARTLGGERARGWWSLTAALAIGIAVPAPAWAATPRPTPRPTSDDAPAASTPAAPISPAPAPSTEAPPPEPRAADAPAPRAAPPGPLLALLAPAVHAAATSRAANAPPADDDEPAEGTGRAPAGKPSTGASGGKKKISLDEFLVEGQLEKPSAYYILRRSQLEHDWARLDARFSPLVLESVQDPLF